MSFLRHDLTYLQTNLIAAAVVVVVVVGVAFDFADYLVAPATLVP